MALTYPSVLGSIIYFFFDALVQTSLIPFLDKVTVSADTNITTQYHFFKAFGMNKEWGLITFIIITLTISIHHSIDYLYSKYSESGYGFKNFLWDITIAFLLAIAYITISRGAIYDDFNYIKYAFSIFWGALSITYWIFICWDKNAYFQAKQTNKELAIFYKKMILWHEISALALFITFAIIPFFLSANQSSTITAAYVIISTLTLGGYSVWFCYKVYKLEVLTRSKKMTEDNEHKENNQNLVSVRFMELKDIEFCANIFTETYQEVYSELWTQDTSTKRLQELFDNSPEYCFTLLVRNRIQGFLFGRSFSWFDGKRIWLEEIVIKKEHRGKGYGKLLLQSLFEKCENDKVVGISLISEKNSAAYKIYKKIGYSPSSWIHLERDLLEIGED